LFSPVGRFEAKKEQNPEMVNAI